MISFESAITLSKRTCAWEVYCSLDCPRQRSVAWDRCLGSTVWPMRPEALEGKGRPTDLWSFSGRCGRLPWGPRLYAQTLWIQKNFDCNQIKCACVISLPDYLLPSCHLSAKGSWHSKRRKCCPFCEARSHGTFWVSVPSDEQWSYHRFFHSPMSCCRLWLQCRMVRIPLWSILRWANMRSIGKRILILLMNSSFRFSFVPEKFSSKWQCISCFASFGL